MPDDNGLENRIEDMWSSLKPKLDSFEEGVEGAVKTLVVGEIKALEKRMDKKSADAKEETKGVKDAGERIEQMLVKSAYVPSLGAVEGP